VCVCVCRVLYIYRVVVFIYSSEHYIQQCSCCKNTILLNFQRQLITYIHGRSIHDPYHYAFLLSNMNFDAYFDGENERRQHLFSQREK